jgi:hypothetical protein
MNRWFFAVLACMALLGRTWAQSVAVSANTGSYSGAGGTITLTVTLTYTGSQAVGLDITAPANWTFGSAGGPNTPTVVPDPNSVGTFGLSYLGPQTGPQSFSFTVNYPAGLTGNQVFTGITGIFRANNTLTTVPVADITLAPPPSPSITSATAVAAATGQPFSYTITASNGATTFSASGLPAWLSANGATISGTPPSAGSFTFTVSASSPYGSDSKSVTVTAGAAPSVTSSLTASGKVGDTFSYSITGSEGASSFGASALPSGLSVSGSTISGTPTQAGSFNVGLSASNSFGTGTATLALTITAGNAPVIVTQPHNYSVTVGGNITLSVEATGATSYQWKKNGTAIAGATTRAFTRDSAAFSDAGNYLVVVSNLSGSVTSNEVTVTVNPPNSGASISAQPLSQTVGAGTKCVLSVTAGGTAPLSYQWRKNGSSIGGATNDAYTIAHTWTENAGDYSVTVTNAFGAVTSNAATLAVKNVEYFGTLGTNGGSFALYVRGDRTGVFLAYANASKVALVTKDLVFDLDGRFSIKTTTAAVQQALWSGSRTNATPSEWESRPSATVEATTEYTIAGSIGDDGTLAGSISELGLSLSAPAPVLSGSTSSAAGFYQSGAVGSSAVSYTIISPTGDAFVATVTPTGTDAGQGTVDSVGNVAVTTAANTTVTGTVNAGTSIQITAAKSGSTPMTFSGGTTDTHAERLINIATRAYVGAGDATLTAGFAISGNQPKQVLIRGVGPGLAAFGVSGTIANPQIKLYQGQTYVTENSSWSTSPDAAAIAAAGRKVGAFPLPAGSKDAVLLINLQPNTYTVQLTTTDGASGVGLVEVYEVP